ncbi:hypothetical protein NC651_018850 [Populus alba x Populus x berolinensis]|nr:hypothetical protein NC651_018850 [Populus alba x Populus x berolinensis]
MVYVPMTRMRITMGYANPILYSWVQSWRWSLCSEISMASQSNIA